jgi:thiamine pyrophosphate-dependent acetolactate synthase large subunit-like protein
MHVYERVAETLVSLGVTHAFGVIGSGNYAVTRAMIERGVRYHAARHEGGAASMADAFSRLQRTVPVVSVHQGCGLTNAITGICEASKSSTPLIILSAEVAAASIHSNFRIDQTALVESVGGVSFRITSKTAGRDIALAYRTAVTRRVPVLVNLPLDVQAEHTTEPPTERDASVPANPAPRDIDVQRLADLVRNSQRPVIIGGRGAVDAGAELRHLGEASGALLATGAVVRGLFHGDPWNLDVAGGFSTPLAARLISEADLILSFGSALNMWTMRHGELIGADAKVVQVDVDPMAPGRHRPVDLGILGDSAATATALSALLAEDRNAPRRYRTAEVRRAIESEGRWNDLTYQDLGGNGRIDPRTLTIALNEMLDDDRVVAVDSGNFLGWPSMFLDVQDERSLCFSQAFQCVGLGLASALGAALARPDKLPVLGTGDGGILMAASELETVVRLNVAMVIIVYNDAAYGAEVHHFGRTENDTGFVTFPDVDIAAIARGYGFTGVTVRQAEDLKAVRDWLSGPRDTPILIDAKVADQEPSWWLQEAFKGH